MLSTLGAYPQDLGIKGTECRMLPDKEKLSYDIDFYHVEIIEPFENEIALLQDVRVTQLLQQDRTGRPSGDGSNLSEYKDKDGNTLAMVLAQKGKLEILQTLKVAGLSIKQRSNSGATALHFAAAVTNNCKSIIWLASNGVDVNTADTDGRKPILISAYEGHLDAVGAFVDNGADVNSTDKHDRTPLMAAAQQGHINVVKKLMELGADVTCQTNSGKTALFYAAIKKHKEVVRVLVQADKQLINQKDSQGQTVAMKCVATGNIEMLQLLHSLGAKLDIKDNQGVTALMIAARTGTIEIVHYLTEKGVPIETQNSKGQSACSFAAASGNKKVLEALLQAGCPVNDGDGVGNGPLILATLKGSKECVKLLLDHHADIDQQNTCGKTALMEAILCNNCEIAKLLHENGASLALTPISGACAKDLASASPEKSIREYFSRLAGADEVKQLFLAVELENVEIIEQSTHNLNIRNEKGFTPLMVAAARGSVQMIRSLITKGSSLNLQTKDGMTAIGCAVGQGNLKAVDILIGYGADINMKNTQGETLLHRWVNEGSLPAVKVIERLGANLEVTDKSSHTALMLASQNDNMEIAIYLVESGANLSTRRSDGLKAADCAKSKRMQHYLTEKEKECTESTEQITIGRTLIIESRNHNSKKIKQLLASKAPVNFRDSLNKGTTALMQACKLGHESNVKKLCDAGAKTYVKGDDGDTPLFSASFHGHTRIVKYLLERAANPNTVDSAGRTPIMCASQQGHAVIMELLIKYGALVNIREKKVGSNALNYAVHRGNFDIITLLLEHGANIDQVDYEGRTALTSVCLSGYLDVVKCLVEKGANVNHTDSLGRTPLMAASQEGRLNVVQFLVENGADVSIASNNGMNVIDYAERKGQFEVVRWLQEHGGSSGSRTRTLGQGNTSKIIDMRPNDIEAETTKYTPVAKLNVNEQLQNLCETGESAEDMADLIEQGAAIDEKDAEGVTPLLKAVRNRNRCMAHVLLDAGADVNTKDLQGCSPLLQAVKNKDKDMIEMLIQFNVDVEVVDNYGDDVFSHATKAKDEEMVMTLIQLFESGPESSLSKELTGDVVPEEMPTPEESRNSDSLLTAVQSGDIHRVRDVVQYVDPNFTDECGRNAVHYCSNQTSSAELQIIECLYNTGTDINLKDVLGQTPLIECCQTGNSVVASKLLELGADSGVISAYGVDALQEACLGNHCELVDILLQSARWPSDSINKSVSYGLMNNFDTMISTFHSHGVNVYDIYVSMSIPIVVTHLCLQNLHNLGMWDLCLLLASENKQVDLISDMLADVSSETKDHAFTFAVQRGDFEVASTISNKSICFVFDISGQVNLDEWPDAEDSGFDDEYSPDDIEIQNHINQAMASMYKMLTNMILRESPDCIQGFSRSWSEPEIYIYTAKSGKADAKEYVEKRVKKFHREVIRFRYTEQQGEALFLARHLRAGAAVTLMDDNQYQRMSQQQSNIIGSDLELATITCFMHSQGTNNSLWAVTVGHLVSQLIHEDNGGSSQGCAVGQTARDAGIVRLSNIRKSALTRHKIEDKECFIDVSMFEVTDEVEQQPLLEMEIGGDKIVPDIFTDSDEALLDIDVCKTGIKTGYTEGKVTETERTACIGNLWCTGLFVVVTPGGVFAAAGDSGAAVLDKKKKELLGLVIGTLEHLTFCVRMDYIVKYVKDKWHLDLSFNQSVPASTQESGDNDDILQLEQIRQNYLLLQRDHAALKRVLTQRESTITLLRRDKKRLTQTVKKYSRHITKHQSQVFPHDTATSTIQDIGQRTAAYQRPDSRQMPPNDRATSMKQDSGQNTEETEMKDVVSPELNITQPGEQLNSMEQPPSSVSRKEPQPVLVYSKEQQPSSVSRVDKPPLAVNNVEESPSSVSTEHPPLSEEPVMFSCVGEEQERQLIGCLNSSTQESLRSVRDACMSRSSSMPDSMAHYMQDDQITGYTLLSMIKRLSLKTRDIRDIFKIHKMERALALFVVGHLKETLYKHCSELNFTRLLGTKQALSHSQIQDIVDCEFRDERTTMIKQFLSGISDWTTIRDMAKQLSRGNSRLMQKLEA